MAAVSLFWDTNMAAMTSCENTQYIDFYYLHCQRTRNNAIHYTLNPDGSNEWEEEKLLCCLFSEHARSG